jgi:DNA primase
MLALKNVVARVAWVAKLRSHFPLPLFPYRPRSSSMSFTEESKLQVLQATDIVDVIGAHVTLKKAGTNYLGLCPFHPERTPSFNVYTADGGSFHCFGCKKSGDAIAFLRDHLGMTFVDALQDLARRVNIQLVEEARSPEMEMQYKVKSTLIKIHNDAAKWMHQMLLKLGGAGPDAAREYMKKRGLNSEIAGRWQIGYAPDDVRLWKEWGRTKGYKDEELVESGLFISRVDGQPRQGTYMRFRHRVMFPVHNDHGDVIAFSGRILDAEQKGGKYINSPETPIFNKSQVLFGWDKTRRAVSKEDCAIVCEGQIDLITAVEFGVTNMVAPLGTAFTEHHARMLRRAASQVTLCFDADNAGYKAARKCFQLMAPEGMFIKVATLPPGEDPDSFIRTKGADAFKEYLGQATDFFEFLIKIRADSLLPGKDLEKSRLAGELAENLVLLSDKIVQDMAINRCATRMNVPTEDLRLLIKREQIKLAKEAKNKREIHARAEAKNLPPGTVKAAPDPGEPAPPPTTIAEQIQMDADAPQIQNWALRHLLRLALTDEETLSFLHEQGSSSVTPWRGYPGGDLIDSLLRAPFTPGDPVSLQNFLAKLDANASAIVKRLLAERRPKTDDFLAGQGSFYRLEYDNNRRQQQLVAQQLRRPNQDLASITTCMQELQRLKRQEVELEKKLPKLELK